MDHHHPGSVSAPDGTATAARCEVTRDGRPVPARAVDSRQLLAGGCEVLIRHGEAEYRLRETRAGKLILTK